MSAARGVGKLPAALREHDLATAELLEAARAVPAERWLRPLSPGKWSPAEVVEHLCLTYETLRAELGGAPGMALRTRGWQRLLLRFTLRPRLLAGGRFPRGVRAPREIRPGELPPEREEGLARFRRCADDFRAAVEVAHAGRPGVRLTHAYFGALPLAEAVRFSAVHVRHHRGQLLAGITDPIDPSDPPQPLRT